MNLPNPGIEPRSPALQVDSLPTELSGKPRQAIDGLISDVLLASCYKNHLILHYSVILLCKSGHWNLPTTNLTPYLNSKQEKKKAQQEEKKKALINKWSQLLKICWCSKIDFAITICLLRTLFFILETCELFILFYELYFVPLGPKWKVI